MTSTPLVSVMIPCFNGVKYIADALASVCAQTYQPLETIVIDDGSTDASAELVRARREVQYVYQSHGGLGAALNRGIALATGEYYSFLDADDLWTEAKLAAQMKCFQNDATLEIVFGHVEEFYDDLALRERAARAPVEGYFKGTMLIRRAAFWRVGQFDPQWRVGDFIDWYIRAQEQQLKSMMLPDVLLKRRIHTDNMSVRERDSRNAYLHILKQALDRRQGK